MQPPQGPYQQQPVYPGYVPPQEDGQWTQRPLPGQGAPDPYYGAAPGQAQMGQMPQPGQVPPPANITLPPQYAYAPQPGPAPDDANAGANAAPEGKQEDAQTTRVVRPGAAPVYTLPKTGIPAPRKKGSMLPWVMLAAVILGIGVFIVMKSMTRGGQAAYGYVRFGALSARYAGDAVVVRSETVYAQSGVSQIEYVADEGTEVKRGDTVATIYTSGFSSREWTTLQNYRNQIKEYHKVLIGNAAADTRLLSLTTQVRERALEAQRLVHGSRGSLSGQETLLKESMAALRVYMRQKYPDDQKLSRLYDEENNQTQRISTWSKQFAAVNDGLVSFYTDGYEPALNMSTYADFTPAQVRAMYNGRVPEVQGQTSTRNSTDIYRLVKKEPWCVLLLCSDQDWTPVAGRVYEMMIENFEGIPVIATVESFTRSGGELLVRLSVNNTDVLQNVLYIRSCKVRVGESVNTLMVPSRAIYIQNGRKGVVMATEGGEYWTAVEVVSDDGTSAYVIPENAGVLYEGAPIRLF